MQHNNVAVLMGRLTAEPELKNAGGTDVVNFCIAVERQYARQGENRQTDFVDCVAWRNTATFISKYFHRGDMISVAGTIQTRSYEVDGKRRKATEINCESVGFTGSRGDSVQQSRPSVTEDIADGDVDESKLPF